MKTRRGGKTQPVRKGKLAAQGRLKSRPGEDEIERDVVFAWISLVLLRFFGFELSWVAWNRR